MTVDRRPTTVIAAVTLMVALAACRAIIGYEDARAIGTDDADARSDAPTTQGSGDASMDAGSETLGDGAVPDAHVVDLAATIGGEPTSACAVRATGSVWCWGATEYGLAGTSDDTCGERPCRVKPSPVAGLDRVKKISLGQQHACALRDDDTVWCWGRNDKGQLGHDPASDPRCGDSACNPTPRQVLGLSTLVAQISAGIRYTCASTKDGRVYCWGDNADGRLGRGTTDPTPSFTPQPVVDISNAVTIEAGALATACATTSSGEVHCWGYAGNGVYSLLTRNPTSDERCGAEHCSTRPARISNITDAIQVVALDPAVCALSRSGQVACWGWNVYGVFGQSSTLGDDRASSSYQPLVVTGLPTSIVALTRGGGHVCGRRMSGEVHCWGMSQHGQLGTTTARGVGDPGDECGFDFTCDKVPTRAGTFRSSAIAGSSWGTLALESTGTILGWGLNASGVLGHRPGTGTDATCRDKAGTPFSCNPIPSAIALPAGE